MEAGLVPELYVSDLAASQTFYKTMGFAVRYERPDEGFAFIETARAAMMLEEPLGRVWLTGSMEQPFGRGVNFQIAVDKVDALFSLRPTTAAVVLSPETRTYRRASDQITVRQFVIADPDGYLLRFSEVLTITPAPPQATP